MQPFYLSSAHVAFGVILTSSQSEDRISRVFTFIIMKRKIWKIQNAVCASVLSLLGFGGCGDNVGVDMYGTPHADYSIKGAVQTKEGKPIQGIKVSVTYETDTLGTALSDEKGTFAIQKEAFPYNKLKVSAEDIDGEKNGSYKDTSVDLEISQQDYKGGESWYNGKVEKEVNIRMEEKNHE